MFMPFSVEHEVGFAGELIHAYPAPVHTLYAKYTMQPLCAPGALPSVNDLCILPLIPL